MILSNELGNRKSRPQGRLFLRCLFGTEDVKEQEALDKAKVNEQLNGVMVMKED